MREVASFGRPSTSWLVRAVTNLTVYNTKLLGMGKVGRVDGEMPAYILDNRHVLSLKKRVKTGEPYTDNLCYFRCLSVLVDCHCAATIGDNGQEIVCPILQSQRYGASGAFRRD